MAAVCVEGDFEFLFLFFCFVGDEDCGDVCVSEFLCCLVAVSSVDDCVVCADDDWCDDAVFFDAVFECLVFGVGCWVEVSCCDEDFVFEVFEAVRYPGWFLPNFLGYFGDVVALLEWCSN